MTALNKITLTWRYRALLAIAVLMLITLFLLAAASSREGAALVDELKAARLESLRLEAAAELNAYYRGDGDWFTCYRLLKKIERLEE